MIAFDAFEISDLGQWTSFPLFLGDATYVGYKLDINSYINNLTRRNLVCYNMKFTQISEKLDFSSVTNRKNFKLWIYGAFSLHSIITL